VRWRIRNRRRRRSSGGGGCRRPRWRSRRRRSTRCRRRWAPWARWRRWSRTPCRCRTRPRRSGAWDRWCTPRWPCCCRRGSRTPCPASAPSSAAPPSPSATSSSPSRRRDDGDGDAALAASRWTWPWVERAVRYHAARWRDDRPGGPYKGVEEGPRVGGLVTDLRVLTRLGFRVGNTPSDSKIIAIIEFKFCFIKILTLTYLPQKIR